LDPRHRKGRTSQMPDRQPADVGGQLFTSCGLPRAFLARALPLWSLLARDLVAGECLEIMRTGDSQRTGTSLEIVRFKTAKYTVERPLDPGARRPASGHYMSEEGAEDLLLRMARRRSDPRLRRGGRAAGSARQPGRSPRCSACSSASRTADRWAHRCWKPSRADHDAAATLVAHPRPSHALRDPGGPQGQARRAAARRDETMGPSASSRRRAQTSQAVPLLTMDHRS
jgi:hypothetical protein